MSNPRYHVHLDAAHLPEGLMNQMIQEGGYHFDDFPHEIKVDGKNYPARHMTKYLHAPVGSTDARRECLRLENWARAHNFLGIIQCEYVMEQMKWEKKEEKKEKIPTPFKISSRPIDPKKGEEFKKHEMHLELDKTSSPAVIDALKECGFHILENERNITFTTSGNTREMLQIRKHLRKFLQENEAFIAGHFTYEATTYWSFHGVQPESMPTIAESITVLQ